MAKKYNFKKGDLVIPRDFSGYSGKILRPYKGQALLVDEVKWDADIVDRLYLKIILPDGSNTFDADRFQLFVPMGGHSIEMDLEDIHEAQDIYAKINGE